MAQISLRSLYSLSKVAIFVWLAFLASQTGMSQRKANCELSIYGSLKIDVCGNANQKQFILVMSIGKVLRSDSLYGFNYQISYDTGKVKFTDALYLNTLSEFFEMKSATFNAKEGKINGYAITLGMEPVYGDRPLIAFNGIWKTDCPDSAVFRIDYIEFTDEFKILIDTLKSVTLYGDVFYSKDRILEISTKGDTIETQNPEAILDMDIKIPKQSRLENVVLNVYYPLEKMSIDSATLLDGNLELLFIEKNNGNVKVHIANKNDNGVVNSIRFYSTISSVNEYHKVTFVPEFENYCKCVSGYISDSLLVIYHKQIDKIEEENNENDIDGIYYVYIFDLLGNLVKMEELSGNRYDFLGDKLKKLPNGTYFLVKCNEKLEVIERKIYVNY
jgi:hypothetical protein